MDQEEISSDNESIPELTETEELSPVPLTLKSKVAYNKVYNEFMTWRKNQCENSFSEKVLIAYFTKLKEIKKPTTLWTIYSMLKKTLSLNHQVSFDRHHELREYIKKAGIGHQHKKSRKLSGEDVAKFLHTAPDFEYLVEKAILIIGICGACRRLELTLLKASNVKDNGSSMSIKIEGSQPRSFSVVGDFYRILKRYASFRPRQITMDRFFLTFRNNRCIQIPIGINRIGSVPAKIARFLKLPEPDQYTGHCFRRTSSTFVKDNATSVTCVKRFSGVSTDSKDNEARRIPIDNSTPIKPVDSSTNLICRQNITTNGVSTANIKNTPVNNTLNLDGFKFVVVEIDRRVEVVQKGWTPPEGAEYVKPHAIFDSYKSASDYAETINVKKTPRVTEVPPNLEVISIDADSSNCPEASTPEVKNIIKPVISNTKSNTVINNKFEVPTSPVPTSTATTSPGSVNPKRIIGTLVNKNASQSIRVTSAGGVIKTKRFIGTLVNKNFTKNSPLATGNQSHAQKVTSANNVKNLDSRNVKSGNVFIVVEKVDNSSNVITGDVTQNSNPSMEVDTKDPTLTSSLSDTNTLEEPIIKEDLEIKEEFINEEFIDEEELMVVDPLAI